MDFPQRSCSCFVRFGPIISDGNIAARTLRSFPKECFWLNFYRFIMRLKYCANIPERWWRGRESWCGRRWKCYGVRMCYVGCICCEVGGAMLHALIGKFFITSLEGLCERRGKVSCTLNLICENELNGGEFFSETFFFLLSRSERRTFKI